MPSVWHGQVCPSIAGALLTSPELNCERNNMMGVEEDRNRVLLARF